MKNINASLYALLLAAMVVGCGSSKKKASNVPNIKEPDTSVAPLDPTVGQNTVDIPAELANSPLAFYGQTLSQDYRVVTLQEAAQHQMQVTQDFAQGLSIGQLQFQLPQNMHVMSSTTTQMQTQQYPQGGATWTRLAHVGTASSQYDSCINAQQSGAVISNSMQNQLNLFYCRTSLNQGSMTGFTNQLLAPTHIMLGSNDVFNLNSSSNNGQARSGSQARILINLHANGMAQQSEFQRLCGNGSTTAQYVPQEISAIIGNNSQATVQKCEVNQSQVLGAGSSYTQPNWNVFAVMIPATSVANNGQGGQYNQNPNQGYPNQGGQYGQPNQGYPNQGQQYGQPNQGQQYGQPNQGYPNQGQQYGQPNQGYPNQGQQYGQPNQGYPNQGQQYGQPNQGQQYQDPSQTWGGQGNYDQSGYPQQGGYPQSYGQNDGSPQGADYMPSGPMIEIIYTTPATF